MGDGRRRRRQPDPFLGARGRGPPSDRVHADRAIPALLDDDIDRALDEIVVAIEAAPVPRGDGLVLVLDDVHELASTAALRGLERLVAQSPAGFRLVFTTRHDLDLGLARRRLHGDVVDLPAADLAFTPEEGRRALQPEIDAGLLDLAAADALVDRITGWPAGVRLAQLVLRTAPASGVSATSRDEVLNAVSGASPQVAEYLAAEVLGGLAPDVRGFLLDTSILVDLAPEVCDAVTGRTDSLAVLRSLVTDQVFTSLVDPASSTFRVHRLFREFLVSVASERTPETRVEAHRRAMRWAQSVDDLDGVVVHAVAANEHPVALEMLGERLFDVSNRGQIDDMWRWVSSIGTERVLADRVLAALPAWVSLNQRRYDEIDPWLDAIAVVDGVSDDHLRVFAIHAAVIRATRDRHLGDLAASVAWAVRGVELAAASPAVTIAPTAHAALAQSLALTGDPGAIDAAQRAIELAGESGQEPVLVMAFGALAMAVDDADEASAAVDASLSYVTTPDLERFHRPALAWYARARVALDGGLVADADVAVARAIDLASSDEPAVLALAEALRARILHLLGCESERRLALRAAVAIADELVGGEWVESQVRAAHAATRFAPGEDDALPVGARDLSERELAVLALLPFGLPRRELAAQLYVSENTVKTHLTSIRRKLGLRGRADVVERARQLGLLDSADGAALSDG